MGTRSLAHLVLLVSVAAAVACKPPKQAASNVESLDNFTAGTMQTRHQCGVAVSAATVAALPADQRAKFDRIEAPTAALRLTAAGALAAVPLPLQTFFFAHQDNRLVVATDAAHRCASAGLSVAEQVFAGESNPVVESCWRLVNGHLEIVLPADPAKIAHGLVRVFAYVYTELVVNGLGKGLTNPELVPNLQGLRARYVSQAAALTQAFLDEPRMPDRARVRLTAFSAAAGEKFQNFVVAEAIDSFYCSKATRQTFQAQFPQTWDVFTIGPSAMQKDFGAAVDQRLSSGAR